MHVPVTSIYEKFTADALLWDAVNEEWRNTIKHGFFYWALFIVSKQQGAIRDVAFLSTLMQAVAFPRSWRETFHWFHTGMDRRESTNPRGSWVKIKSVLLKHSGRFNTTKKPCSSGSRK